MLWLHCRVINITDNYPMFVKEKKCTYPIINWISFSQPSFLEQPLPLRWVTTDINELLCICKGGIYSQWPLRSILPGVHHSKLLWALDIKIQIISLARKALDFNGNPVLCFLSFFRACGLLRFRSKDWEAYTPCPLLAPKTVYMGMDLVSFESANKKNCVGFPLTVPYPA